MMDGQATDPPQGTPGRRALGAMESAVRRARASVGEPPTAVAATRRPAPANPPADPPPPSTSSPPGGGRSDRWLITSVAVAAVLVVAAVVALVVSLNTGGTPAPSASSPAAPAPISPGHAARPPDTAGHGRAGTPSAPSSPTSTTVPPPAGGPPVISALSPSSGTAGQGIEVAGANFLSSSGQIVATFNGQIAPTSCPAQNTCSVTVPPMSGGQSAQVVITTASGTSNALTFTYD